MSAELVEKFSKPYDIAWPDGSFHKFVASLEVQRWHTEKDLIAYSFNDDSLQYCELIAEALKKYKRLKIQTGVSGGTKHYLIQESIRRHLENILGDHLVIAKDDTGYRFGCYTFEYKD